MAKDERSDRLRASGFTERQARFLVLVLEHAGVCLPRQYRAFTGIAHGRQTHQFFQKLTAGGFATTDLAAPAHAGRVYHLQYKPWYRLLGEPDHRHRRPMSVGRAVERLMVLDGVLAEPDVTWLGLARDKVAAPAPLIKTGPANGAPGQGTPVALTWTTTLTDPGYTVCWDQTNNNVCDTMWWPNEGSPVKWAENLAPGTYYWQVRAQREARTILCGPDAAPAAHHAGPVRRGDPLAGRRPQRTNDGAHHPGRRRVAGSVPAIVPPARSLVSCR